MCLSYIYCVKEDVGAELLGGVALHRRSGNEDGLRKRRHGGIVDIGVGGRVAHDVGRRGNTRRGSRERSGNEGHRGVELERVHGLRRRRVEGV